MDKRFNLITWVIGVGFTLLETGIIGILLKLFIG